MLERCLQRLEWDKVKDAEAKAAADQFEAERAAMQSIDWCAPAPRHFHCTTQPQLQPVCVGHMRHACLALHRTCLARACPLWGSIPSACLHG